jgi:hypothetical protein
MEAVVSAIIGDLAGRSISFLVDTYLNLNLLKAPIDGELEEERLQRLLRRAHVIAEEADRRRITSHAMLRQLDVLRGEMYRGYHALDHHTVASHRARSKDGDGGGAAVSHHPFAVSQFSPVERARLMIGGGGGGGGGRPRRNEKRRLQQVLKRLETIVADVKDEFVVFLTACPPLSRQPYIMHMVIGKCMFGRQMEMERVVAFLLHQEEDEEGGNTQKLGILPIVGPRRSGKSTLVEHACNDERVRAHFSQIVSFTLGNLKDDDGDMVNNLRSRGRVISNHCSSADGGRVLVIVELDGDRSSSRATDNNDATIMEDLVRKLCIPCVSKIVVTSRSDNKIASLGAAEPLRLDYVAQEACWYFFKVLAFGSTNTAEHPELVSIAMDMAVEMDRCFGLMEVFAQLLRSNFDARFWSSTLAVLREYKKKNLLMNDDAAHEHSGGDQNPEVTTETEVVVVTSKRTQEFVYHDDYELIGSVVDGEAPMISWHHLLFQGNRPRGKFDVLGWKSHIPPYYSYVYSCEILRPQCTVITHHEDNS